ncbi:uncharacterized protein I303_107457 [Kwoniella dejecticola CBS 10117]|uniref:Ornithine decarboxylase antizyme n=1 Tax=Kwoniella dejecticola CBS 10117 TaxID=1296121 RepID=A0A1A5ZZT1_9TREE|nr:uncharacterized protein I303_06862 [Kwoniella dejecticola CBS 10117]OBR83298.1 hypothetical protein I303_06862 [Kwoniella dejecticola CBS 10117]
MSPQPKSITINRNLRPAGGLGNAGAGASSTSPLLFSTRHLHDIDNPYNAPLAIARAGGTGGQVYVYADEAGCGDHSSYASFAGGGRHEVDIDNASESSENTRDSLMSYLHHPSSQQSSSTSSSAHAPHRGSGYMSGPLTPPSSFTQSVDIPQQPTTQAHHSFSLPLTPISASSMTETSSPSPLKAQGKPIQKTVLPTKQEREVISLISSIFPSHFQSISSLSSTLEIVTPPSNILKGFVVDHTHRTVFIHLPPRSISSNPNQRPETLSPNFSQVLRPHDPLLSISPPTSANLSSSPISMSNMTPFGLDIKESLTALLDLSADALEASNLVLVLDRDENDQESLGELLHSLMYVGGQVLKSPAKSLNSWEWDIRRWVLVGMDL